MRTAHYKNRSIKSIFTELYEPIGDREMVSGSGSDLVQTAAIARESSKAEWAVECKLR